MDGEVPTSVASWVRAYSNTDDGRAIMPQKAQPTVHGLPQGSTVPTSMRFVTMEDLARGRVKPEDLLANKVRVK
jgi:hypothetical protein